MSTAQTKSALAAIVGADNASEEKNFVVVKPANNEEVASVVQWASQEGVKLAVVGGGTSQGFKPEAEVIVSLANMNKILDLDHDNMLVRVQAGKVTADFQKELLGKDLYFPIDPFSKAKSTLGGNVACRASGATAMSHGETVDFLLGLTVILPTGEILTVGGKNYKNVSALDLNRLYGGSRGRFGIITEMIFRILPKPEVAKTILVTFNSLVDAAKGASDLTMKGTIPNRLELIDYRMFSKLGDKWPDGYKAEAAALIEVEGYHESIEHQIDIIKQGLSQYQNGKFIVVSDGEAEKLWQARTEIAELITADENYSFGLVVDPQRLPQAVDEVVQAGKEKNISLGLVVHGSASHLQPVLFNTGSNSGGEIETAVRERIKKLGGDVVKNGLSSDVNSGDLIAVLTAGLIKVFDPQGLIAG